MKNFNEFREDQFHSIVENLSEEDRNYIMEVTGDNPGLGMGLLGLAARTAKFGLYDVPKFAITKVAKPVVSKTWNMASKALNSPPARAASKALNSPPARALYGADAAWSTGKSIQNKEPWYQTASKGLQGFYAKKVGGVKRATAGLVGQSVLPNKDKGWGPKWLTNRFKK